MKLKVLCLILLPLSASTVSGCGLVVKSAVEAVSKNMLQANTATANTAYVQSLKSIPSGSGLVVCEPVTQQKSVELAEFGAGCTRWLHLHAGGQGELGKTPLWGTLDNARKTLGSPNLRLTTVKGQALARSAGATHVATSDISETNEAIRLVLKLQSATDGAAVGEPLVLKGTREQIVDQIPSAARKLAVRLGAKNPTIPQKIAVAPADLQFLGKAPWWGAKTNSITPADTARLLSLSAREALAGVLLQRSGTLQTDAAWTPVVAQLMRHTPQNSLVMGEVCYLRARLMAPHRTTFDKLATRFPNNYLLASAQACLARIVRNRVTELAFAERAVRAAPANVTAWFELSAALSNSAGDLRMARYANQISATQWTTLGDLYSKRLAVTHKITKLAPNWTYSWSELAAAATFAGSQNEAENALWKALQLDAGNGEAYAWGLEMFQPKWGGSRQDLFKLATQAALNADKCFVDVRPMVTAFHETNQKSRLLPLLQQIVQKDSQNAGAAHELGAIYHYEQRSYRKAEQLYNAALAINPNDGRANSSLGDLHQFVKNDPVGAERLYRHAISCEPSNGYFYANLARFLALNGRRNQAMVAVQKAKALGYTDNHPVWELLGVKP